MHRVLVVEDDPRVREGLRVALEEEGCQVWCASNGQEALDVLRDGAEPCLILLDMNMPVLDGWGFLERWKHDNSFKEIPVVVVSAVSEGELTIRPTETLSKTRIPGRFPGWRANTADAEKKNARRGLESADRLSGIGRPSQRGRRKAGRARSP